MSSDSTLRVAATYGTVPESCPHCGLQLAPVDFGTRAPLLCSACRRQVRAAIRPRMPVSRRAIASLVLAALSPAGSFVTGFLAVVFGLLALRDIRRRAGQVSGKGVAIAGMLLGAGLSVACLPCQTALLMSLLYAERGTEHVVRDTTRLQEELASWQLGPLPAGLRPIEQRTRQSPMLGTQRWLLLADTPVRNALVLAAVPYKDPMYSGQFRPVARGYVMGILRRPEYDAEPDFVSQWICQVGGKQIQVMERYFKADAEHRYVAEFQAMVERQDGHQHLLWASLVDLPGPVEQYRTQAREPVRAFLEAW